MHNIDHPQLEYQSDLDEFEAPRFSQGQTAVFNDADEMELAAELLSVNDEDELDQFLGDLIDKAGRAVGKAIKSPIGRKLGGFLKGAVKKVVPAAAGALGTVVGGPLGGMLAGNVASAAADMFGLELEGLSAEDQEFEAARRFVKFAGEAARQATRAASADDPHAAAKQAVAQAARQFAPGLLRQASQALQSEVAAPAAPRGAASGRWIRQGQKIVLLGI